MDGINGITGGYSLAVLVPLLILNSREEFVDRNFIIVALLSVLIFCFFNFRTKAKCFAGDVGSVSIAFIFALLFRFLYIKKRKLLGYSAANGIVDSHLFSIGYYCMKI